MSKHIKIIHKNIILADKARYIDNFLFKVKGLMFSKSLRKGGGLVLVADKEGILETTIHMLFVFFSIDIIWLNSKKIVVDVKRAALPFTPLIYPKKIAKYILELPKGTAKNIEIGDEILFRKIN